MVLDRLLRGRIRRGSLVLQLPDGEYHYGQGEPRARWVIREPSAIRRMVADPEFMVGQAYMDGAWWTPDLRALLDVLTSNFSEVGARPWDSLVSRLVRPLQQWNRISAARRNVSHHYDLDEWLFRLFLDEDMQYSCGYFPDPEASLEQAQFAKKEHLRRKLLLEPGQHVLDVGCGWGGLAIHLARHAGVRVTGLTLSEEQARVGRERVRAAGLQDRVDIRIQDYREFEGCFDRVVSVGMFEHVGVGYYDTFFRCMADRLTEDGVAVLHTIGRTGPPGVTNPWIRRYIFPGGYIPALSEVAAAVERQGIVTADVEVLRLHYASTLANWYRRFQAARRQVAEAKGERFCRMWEFYLAASESSFRWGGMVVFQLQLARDQRAVPLTRDYLYREPLALEESGRRSRSAG